MVAGLADSRLYLSCEVLITISAQGTSGRSGLKRFFRETQKTEVPPASWTSLSAGGDKLSPARDSGTQAEDTGPKEDGSHPV